MHASQRLRGDQFKVSVLGRAAGLADVYPEWTHEERIGIIVREPFGALGASLLIQAGIALFYAADPDRRDKRAQYPPIFLFHIGGRFGDHSPMDFWPPRRESFLPSDPYEILGAISDRAITRLLVPEAPDAGIDYVYSQPSGCTDLHAAEERIRSAYVYSATGTTSEPTLALTGLHSELDEMAADALDIESLIEAFERSSDQDLLDLELGPSVPADFHGWLASFRSRAAEVPREVRRRLLAELKLAGTPRTQTFRTIAVRHALGALASGNDWARTEPG